MTQSYSPANSVPLVSNKTIDLAETVLTGSRFGGNSLDKNEFGRNSLEPYWIRRKASYEKVGLRTKTMKITVFVVAVFIVIYIHFDQKGLWIPKRALL